MFVCVELIAPDEAQNEIRASIRASADNCQLWSILKHLDDGDDGGGHH